MWLTPEELRDLNAELGRAATRWIERIENPTRRPAGSRPVRIFTATTLVPLSEPQTEPPEQTR